MENETTKRSQGLTLQIAAGISLFLLTALVDTRLASHDPFFRLCNGSRALANLIGFLHLAGVLACWSSLLGGRIGIMGIGVIAASFLASTGGLFVVTRTQGIELAEVMHFPVGHHAWWIVLLVTAFAAVVSIQMPRQAASAERGRWAIAAVVGGGLGGMLHVTNHPAGTAPVMIAKVVLLLLIPACRQRPDRVPPAAGSAGPGFRSSVRKLARRICWGEADLKEIA